MNIARNTNRRGSAMGRSRDFGIPGVGAGKGDVNRSISRAFDENFPVMQATPFSVSGFVRKGTKWVKTYVALVAGLSFFFTGCAEMRSSYKACPYTPSAIHLGTYRTRDTGEYSDCVTLTWSLK